MDAKEAITRAKTYFADIFGDEGITNLGLEEVRREEQDSNWLITLGFSRMWDAGASIAAMTGRPSHLPRSYKIVSLKDSDGSLIAITNRNVGDP